MVAGPSAVAARASSAIVPVRARSMSASTSAWNSGIEALTLFAFSSENWGRPEEEVGALMKLFLGALEREVDELDRRGVRVRFIGERERFAEAIRKQMAAGRGPHPRQHPPAPDHRRQLRRSLGHRPGRALAGRRTSPPAGWRRKTSTRPPSAPASAWPTCRRRICSSAPAATPASAISCCGSWPIPNCGSPSCCGPNWMRRHCSAPWTTTPAASAASA